MTEEEIASVVGKLAGISERLDSQAVSLRELRERVDQLPAEIGYATRRELRAAADAAIETAAHTHDSRSYLVGVASAIRMRLRDEPTLDLSVRRRSDPGTGPPAAVAAPAPLEEPQANPWAHWWKLLVVFAIGVLSLVASAITR